MGFATGGLTEHFQDDIAAERETNDVDRRPRISLASNLYYCRQVVAGTSVGRSPSQFHPQSTTSQVDSPHSHAGLAQLVGNSLHIGAGVIPPQSVSQYNQRGCFIERLAELFVYCQRFTFLQRYMDLLRMVARALTIYHANQ